MDVASAGDRLLSGGPPALGKARRHAVPDRPCEQFTVARKAPKARPHQLHAKLSQSQAFAALLNKMRAYKYEMLQTPAVCWKGCEGLTSPVGLVCVVLRFYTQPAKRRTCDGVTESQPLGWIRGSAPPGVLETRRMVNGVKR